MVFSLIGKFIDSIKKSAAESNLKRESELSDFRDFIEETQMYIAGTSKYPEAELYRHAWKRAVVLKSLFKGTDTERKYESIEKMASDNYFRVAPNNPYRSARLELSQKAYDELLANEKKTLFPEPAKEPKEKKKPISKPRKTKTRNPQYGHNGRTVNNYQYKSDGTSVDEFVNELSAFLGNTDSISIAVSGLTGKPRRHKSTGIQLNGTNEPNAESSWRKTYRIGLLVPRSFCGLGGAVDELLEALKNDVYGDYVEKVIQPLSNSADSIFRKFVSQYDPESVITAGIKSDGRIRIWITITLPVSAREIVVHCGTYLTGYPKKFVDEMTELVHVELKKNPQLFAKIYEDYDVRYKMLRNVEQKLRKLHGAPPIGEGFVSQTALFKLIRKRYPKAQFEHCPRWLGRQRFDIYIPDKRLAIEYNGPQHYVPVDVFGGEEGFIKTRNLDDQKRELSRVNNVRVYEWHFERPISEKELDILYNWIDENCN